MVGATEEDARGRVRRKLWRLLKGSSQKQKNGGKEGRKRSIVRNLDLFTAIFSS